MKLCLAFQESNETTLLWPAPKKVSLNDQAEPLTIDICQIVFKINAVPPDAVQQVVDIYLTKVFGTDDCRQRQSRKGSNTNILMNIVVKNANKMWAEKTEDEKYQLTIR